MTWKLSLDATNDEAYQALAHDAVWNGYVIADLSPPHRAYAQVAVARQEDSDAVATCLILRHPAFNSVVPSGDAEGVAAILGALDLPEKAFVTTQAPYLDALRTHFHIPEQIMSMQRMWVDATQFRPDAKRGVAEQLTIDDVPDLSEFYAGYDGSPFHPSQLQFGPVFGVRREGHIMAAGCTHTRSTEYGIAAIGNILTLPEARGQGYARAVTSALVEKLIAEGCTTVILNVRQDNFPAVQLYMSLGFTVYCPFLEMSITH